MSWLQDLVDPKTRQWEEFYRNRWQHDKMVRSTHGVNCTGGCSWCVYVKDGIVTWEMQQTDYPKLESGIPPYEPRGCQRGISYSWYLYSPIRVKYPYLRGVLSDIWRRAKKENTDPVAAWSSIMENAELRQKIQQARGKGGFRRASWDEALEIIAASTIYTIKKYGPDRIIGFSPIPAMSMLSYGAGSRFLQLLGGVNLSFYDWYCDLPPASPEIWGEQTDVAESADWYNSKFIAVMGSNLNMTRTPDVHYVAEARHNGSKLVVFSPDFSQVSKYSDWWIPTHAGQDGAFWMAVDHVILSEYHHKKQTPYFLNYMKQYTDAPFLITLKEKDGACTPDRMLTAAQVSAYKNEENSGFKFLVFDGAAKKVKMPKGTLGFRWQKQKGQWNLEMKDGKDDSPIEPLLSFLDQHDETLAIELKEFAGNTTIKRNVPIKWIDTVDGKIAVATCYDLLMAQFGVERELGGDYPKSYDDENSPYTPAWQEKFTGIDRKTVIQFAREWASTAELTEGKCSIIIGAGVNHWYHNNLIYRAGIVALMLCGCVGKNGGGLNHYVGQEKLAPVASWGPIAFALDWIKPPRLQNAPSFHYVHSDQWHYDAGHAAYDPSSKGEDGEVVHPMDMQAKAVRLGWLPFFPQFNKNSLDLMNEASAAGLTDEKAINDFIVEKLKKGDLEFSIDDPDAPENWPRLWFIWRGNALMSSAKGHEFFLKHYLGTHTNAVAQEIEDNGVKEVKRREAPQGKFDLIVDINFRMDTSALYSDIVLPTATWYEKDDLNSTDMHSFIHPLTAAVPPCWESRSDWDIFKAFAEKVSELAATHLPEPVKDVVMAPLQHDTPAEMAQPTIKDWRKGECEPIPGKTMPAFKVVERDYVNLYNRYISFGRNPKNGGLGVHGINWKIDDLYEKLMDDFPTEQWNGETYPSLQEARDAANVILSLAPETNGESSYRAFAAEQEKVGLPLTDLAEKARAVKMTFQDIQAQPRRLLNSPIWSGLVTDGRAYSAYCLNVEKLVPWRTLTGRQHFYLDHEGYIAYGENLPTYKPRPDHVVYGDLNASPAEGDHLILNYLTPHGKWHIHSTYSENLRMLTLSRGCEPVWLNDKDAEKLGIKDNDYVQVFNDNGVVVTRCIVSARIPSGACIQYHSPERTVGVPKAPAFRGGRRAGGHNSLTRVRLKPVLMVGGYGQFTYGFNYWGPTGVNRDTFVVVQKFTEEVVF